MGEAAGIILLGLGVALGGLICGLAALARIAELRAEIEQLWRRVDPRRAAPPPPPRATHTQVPPPDDTAEEPAAPLLPAIEETRSSPPSPSPLAPPPPPRGVSVDPVGADAAPEAEPIDWWRDFEKRVGQRWMTWAGGAILFLATAFFIKYAFENEWIGPRGRVCLGIALGIALLVTGHRFVRRGYSALAQGLMGSGLAILYLSVFAAFSLYGLILQGTAFAAMIAFTALGMVLAVVHNAMPIAVLATLGGLLTPVLVATGKDPRDVLFAYLTVLSLGVLGVAFFRRWRALDVLAFLGTAVLYMGWFDKFYKPAALVPAVLWLGVFYLVFLVLPFVYHLRRGEIAPVERFVLALANATFAFGYAYHLLYDEHRHVLGFVALGIAALNTAMGTISRVRLRIDAPQVHAFLGMAVAFLTIAVPLHLELEGITLAWAIEAPVLLFIGYRYGYLPLRLMAAAVLLLAGMRAFSHSFPHHTALFIPVFNRTFGTAIAVPAAAAVFAWIHRRNISIQPTHADRVIMPAAACAAGSAALIFLTGEIGQWFRHAGAAAEAALAYGRYAAGLRIVLWTAASLGFLAVGLRLGSLWSRANGWGVLAVSGLLAFYALWDYREEPYVIFLNVRFLTVLLQIAGVLAWAWLLTRFADRCREEEVRYAPGLAGAAVLILLALVSVEAYNFSHELATNPRDARWMSLGAVSVAWGLYAAIVLAIGFRKKVRWLRYAALGLFGVTIVKLVLLDMAGVRDIYRIVVFFLLGFILIGVAYAYHRIERALVRGEENAG